MVTLYIGKLSSKFLNSLAELRSCDPIFLESQTLHYCKIPPNKLVTRSYELKLSDDRNILLKQVPRFATRRGDGNVCRAATYNDVIYTRVLPTDDGTQVRDFERTVDSLYHVTAFRESFNSSLKRYSVSLSIRNGGFYR